MIGKGREQDLAQLLVLSKALRDEALTMRISTDEAKLTSVYRRAFKRVCLRLFECYRDWACEAAMRESRTGVSAVYDAAEDNCQFEERERRRKK